MRYNKQLAKIVDQNKRVLQEVLKGDVIEFKDRKKSDWGIYEGEANVYLVTTKVTKKTFDNACGVRQAIIHRTFRNMRPLDAEEIVKNITNHVDGPEIVDSQSFVNWCRYGEWSGKMKGKHYESNKNFLAQLQPGEIIKLKRKISSHYCIYIGNSQVVHAFGRSRWLGMRKKNCEVIKSHFWDVVERSLAEKPEDIQGYNILQPDIIVQRALSKIGTIDCQKSELFANWCRYDMWICKKGRNKTFYNENKELYDTLTRGDAVKFDRDCYYHFAIYIGEGKLVHVNIDVTRALCNYKCTFNFIKKFYTKKIKVKVDYFWDVVKKGKASLAEEIEIYREQRKDPESIAQYVESQINEQYQYKFFENNCEHFVNMCRYEEKVSLQVEEWKRRCPILKRIFCCC